MKPLLPPDLPTYILAPKQAHVPLSDLTFLLFGNGETIAAFAGTLLMPLSKSSEETIIYIYEKIQMAR